MSKLHAALQNLSPSQRKAVEALLAKKGVDQQARLPIPRADRGQALPLSFAQQRLWFLWQLEPEGAAYNIPGAIRITGRLDAALLGRCLNALVQRHEALRTVFQSGENGDRQIIQPTLEITLQQLDLSGLPSAEREAEARRLSTAKAQAPFDLRNGPLLRTCLLKLGDEQHLLLVTLHHIVADGWSVDIFLKEFSKLYDAGQQGKEAALSALPVQYADYALWQRDWLAAGESERQLSYWREQLGDEHPLLELPHDRPRPAVLSARGGNVEVQLDLATSERLKAFAKAREMTPFSVWLALYKLLLQRLSGASDLRVGVPVANRGRAEIAGVVGFFVNTLVLRTAFDSQLTFERWLTQVNSVSQQAQAHQDLPFERLVDALQPERSLSHNPLFQAKFNYGFDTSQLPSPAGLTLTSQAAEHLGAHFDLALDIADTPSGFRGFFTYACDLFDEASVKAFASMLQSLLHAALAAPETPLHQMGVAPSAASRQVGEAAAPASTVLALWQNRLDLQPQALAVDDGTQKLSRRELDNHANRLAQALVARGVTPGARVALCLPRSTQWVTALLGVLKAGATYLPLDPTQPPERLRKLLDASAACLVIGQDLSLATPTRSVLTLDAAEVQTQGADAPPVTPTPDQPAYLIYTSGSTGVPKGVFISHGALAGYVQGVLERLAPLADGGMAMVSSVAADLGHTTLFGALCGGRALYLPDDETVRDPDGFAAFISRHAISVLKIVPSHLNGLLLANPNASLLPRHALILGGESSSAALLERVRQLAPECRVFNHYGPSETTVGVLTYEWPLNAATPAKLALGKPLPGYRVEVLDADLNPVSIGVAGELYIGGAGLALGYLNQPGQTAERFIADPAGGGARLYRSGDRVRLRRDGELEFIGRFDEQVKLRGYRVEPNEIAEVLKALDEVRDAAVLLIEDPDGLQLGAYCVAAPGITLAMIQARLREQLPDYLQPARWLLLEALPVTANGKLDRRALLGMPFDGATHEVAQRIAPEGEVETLLAEIWCDVLKREEVGVTDNFFELGGDSILSLQIIARSRKRGLKLTPKQLFEAQTIRGLAQRLEGQAPVVKAPTSEGIPRLQQRDSGVLSFAQQRLWFLWQLVPESSAYTISAAVRLAGEFDEALLKGVFESVVERHEVLRTRFIEVDGEPRQQVLTQADVDWATIDLEPGADVQALVALDAAKPFDLARDPLVRLRLYRLGQGEHVLSLALHHIVGDGWSMNLLIDEFVQAYRSAVNSDTTPLRPLTVQYLDYAAWQRGWLAQGEGQRQLGWWRDYLGPRQPLLELPGDFARPAVQSYRGATHSFSVDAGLAGQLTQQARRHHATPFMLLLGAFAVLLQRYSGQHDLRIGVPLANRSRVELEGLIGLFVNTQILRVQPDPAQPFRTLLERIKADVAGAQAHGDLPFEQLVEALQPQRSLSHNPLFQVMYSHTRQRSQALAQLPGLTLEALPRDDRTAQFDLALNTEEMPDGTFKATFTYATDLFVEASVKRLQLAFSQLLQQLASGLDSPLQSLDLLEPAQRPVLETDPRPAGPDVLAAIAAQVQLTPRAPALSMAGQTLDYAELDRRASRLAHYLRDNGVGPEVLVGIAAERSLELVIGLLAILKAGGAYVPLDPDYPSERLAYMIEDSGVRLLLTQRHLATRLTSAPGEPRIVYLDDLDPAALANYPQTAPVLQVRPDALAYLIYTSGSTGRPKGVGNSHAALANRLAWMQDAYALDATDRVLQKTPFSFDVSVWEFFWPLMNGACLVIAAPGVHREPAQLAALIQQELISTLHFVPSMLQAFVAEPMATGCRSLKRIFCSGEALSVPTLHQAQRYLPQARLYNLYGPTEAAIDVSHWTCGNEQARVPIGLPIANLRLYLLDATLQPVAAGAVGELYIGGAGLARGYHRRAGLSAERFVANPFISDGGRIYRTGDLARLRPDGAIDYLGRSDHQVKLRGLRIELGEIEACLRACQDVDDAAVNVHESVAGAQLVAYVCGGAEREALLSRLRQQLPDYMLPSAFVTLQSLPLNVNGKLDRKALPAPEFAAARDYRPPHTPVEIEVALIWQQLLGVERVGLDDSFFELGGHSLLATQVLARIKRHLAVDLSLRVVFTSENLEALASQVQAALADPGTASEIDSMTELLDQLEMQP